MSTKGSSQQQQHTALIEAVRQILAQREPVGDDAGNGEQFAIEAAQRAVEHAYGRHKAATVSKAVGRRANSK